MIIFHPQIVLEISGVCAAVSLLTPYGFNCSPFIIIAAACGGVRMEESIAKGHLLVVCEASIYRIQFIFILFPHHMSLLCLVCLFYRSFLRECIEQVVNCQTA